MYPYIDDRNAMFFLDPDMIFRANSLKILVECFMVNKVHYEYIIHLKRKQDLILARSPKNK